MTDTTLPAPGAFVVYRSRLHSSMNLVFAALLTTLALINLWDQFESRTALFASFFFAVIAGFYLWHTYQQFCDRLPQLVIDASGLWLGAASPDPIPWPNIWRLDAGRRLFGGPRVEAEVAPEIAARLKLGQRFLGENVVRLRGRSNGFAIFAIGYDRTADQIFAAARHFWPPDDRTGAASPSMTER